MRLLLCMGLAGSLAASGVRADELALQAEPAVKAQPVAEAGEKAGSETTGDADAASTNAVEEVTGEWRGKDVYVYAREAWTLEVTYLNPDTRSEGQQGRLLKEGKPVDAAEKGGSLVTPLGLLKYYGSERKHLWAVTGWNFADRRKMRRSADLPRPAEKLAPLTDPASGGQP